MDNTNNKNARGFVTVAPSHLQKPDQTRYLFSGFDQITGKEVFVTFRPIPVPGHVAPEQFAAHVAKAAALPGTLTLFSPEFDLGRFTYHPPGSTNATETGADDPRQITKEMAQEKPAPEKTRETPAPTPRTVREPSRTMGPDLF